MDKQPETIHYCPKCGSSNRYETDNQTVCNACGCRVNKEVSK